MAWAVSRNLPTSDPELAATFMRATAGRSDRVEKPVYHIALSFDPSDAVDRATMERVADRVLERLGLAEHQAVIVAHRDRAHAHLHLLVNRVDPETGKAWERWKDQPLIQQVLREQERDLGFREVPGRLASLTEQEKPASPRSPAEREGKASPFLRGVARDLAKYEQVVEVSRKQYEAEIAATAARVRLSEVEAASERAMAAAASFHAALAAVYRDPAQAHGAFREAVESRGVLDALRTMRERPEEFGRLAATERAGAFGFVRPANEQAARAAAPEAARKARQAVEADRALAALGTDPETARIQVEGSSRWERDAREDLAQLPRRSDLELRVGQALNRLVPRDFQRLRALLTSPQALLADRLRSAARGILLGQESEHG